MRLDLDPVAIFGCNIAKWTILCIVVHFQPVIKLLQKSVRVHQKRVILMQKNSKFFWGGGTAPFPQWGGGHRPPTPHLPRRLDLNPPPFWNSAYATGLSSDTRTCWALNWLAKQRNSTGSTRPVPVKLAGAYRVDSGVTRILRQGGGHSVRVHLISQKSHKLLHKCNKRHELSQLKWLNLWLQGQKNWRYSHSTDY